MTETHPRTSSDHDTERAARQHEQDPRWENYSSHNQQTEAPPWLSDAYEAPGLTEIRSTEWHPPSRDAGYDPAETAWDTGAWERFAAQSYKPTSKIHRKARGFVPEVIRTRNRTQGPNSDTRQIPSADAPHLVHIEHAVAELNTPDTGHPNNTIVDKLNQIVDTRLAAGDNPQEIISAMHAADADHWRVLHERRRNIVDVWRPHEHPKTLKELAFNGLRRIQSEIHAARMTYPDRWKRSAVQPSINHVIAQRAEDLGARHREIVPEVGSPHPTHPHPSYTHQARPRN